MCDKINKYNDNLVILSRLVGVREWILVGIYTPTSYPFLKLGFSIHPL